MLLPIYLNLLGMTVNLGVVWIVFLYVLAIGLLMVSRLPVFSGKQFGKRVPPEMVLPIFVVAVLFFALLISYPWQVLSIGTFAYLACLPLGYVSYRNYQRKDEAGAATTSAAPVADESGAVPGEPPHAADDDRPSRLN